MLVSVRRLLAAVLPAVVALLPLAAHAVNPGNNNNNLFNNRSVGGIAIDADGVLTNLTVTDSKELRVAREKLVQGAPADLQAATKLRVVSLAGINAALKRSAQEQKPVADDIRYLKGLQRIEFVFVDQDAHDVLIAGPAEGWKVNDKGDVVGVTTGQPVIHLDDLVTALRAPDAAKKVGITCSIDPTKEGRERVEAILRNQKTIGSNPQATIASLEQALGNQIVSVTGVPDSSRFARVLVAADYRMKRLGMKFDPSPVPGLKSYLDLATPGSNLMPRWWLSPNYEALLRDPAGLTYKISGGVKCLAEEDMFNRSSNPANTTGPAATWAKNMTEKYEELAKHDAIWSELRNCFDLAVVGALIAKDNLVQKAGADLGTLLNTDGFKADAINAPKKIASQATFLKKGSNWLISVSGGVSIQPWQVVMNTKEDASLADVRKQALNK